ncbi:MAG: hypothetical protein ACLQL2_06890 [Methylovirgula sp.]
MFEIGKEYLIRTIESVDGEWSDGRSVYTVVEVSGTLVKLHNGFKPDRILNTASLHFVGADRIDRKTESPELVEIDRDDLDDKL